MAFQCLSGIRRFPGDTGQRQAFGPQKFVEDLRVIQSESKRILAGGQSSLLPGQVLRYIGQRDSEILHLMSELLNLRLCRFSQDEITGIICAVRECLCRGVGVLFRRSVQRDVAEMAPVPCAGNR